MRNREARSRPRRHAPHTPRTAAKSRAETDALLAEAAIEAELIQLLAEAVASYAQALSRIAHAVKAIPGSNEQPLLPSAERDDLLITIAQLGGARIKVNARGKISIKTDVTALSLRFRST